MSTTLLGSPYKEIYDVLREIKTFRDKGYPYNKIGEMWGVSGSWIWHIEHGIEPRRADLRIKFGLVPIEITPDMYRRVLICSVEGCNVPFIPNTPKRKKCFKCVPFRKRKPEEK